MSGGLEWQFAIYLSHRASPPALLCPAHRSMVNNAPVKTLQHNDLTIEGYSRAAVQTYWRFPELKLGFDLGAQPWSFMGTETWFVTHGHLDHCGALPVYVARRRMMKMTPPVIYMPAEMVDPVQKILHQFTRLDRGRLPCELKPVAAGDEIELSRELVVTAIGDAAHGAIAGVHRVGSAAEAEAGVPVAQRRRDSRPAAVGEGSDRGNSPAACGVFGRQLAGRAGRLRRRCTKRKS